MNLTESFSLQGRTALVTGAVRGIGKAIAAALVEAGATAIVHGRSDNAELAATVADLQRNGGQVLSCAADLSDEAAVRRLIDEAQTAAGRIDILVLNASAEAYQTIEDFTPDELMRQTSVNLQATMLLLQALIPGMQKAGWGRLLTIGSVNQFKPAARLALYAAGKCALNNLMMTCAATYAADGINANNLAPGLIETERTRGLVEDEDFRTRLLERIPARRMGSPDECAALALLLCSDAGAYITGANIPVTGGMHL